MAEKITIARPYANALFELAKDQSSYNEWSGMLKVFADLVKDSKTRALIGSPFYNTAQIIDLFTEIKDYPIDSTVKNLIKILAESGRLSVLPEISSLFDQMKDEMEGVLGAEVVLAKPLSDSNKDQLDNIAAALERRLGRKITLSYKVDESLLGGAVIRAGDMVIDGSAIGRLNQLAAELLH
ncbi:F0F1 ATP synthase subunit delta [Candidatus Nitrosacidococcus tergens]|uniref:ATP synthase subunit delta n=1 Tax=Candidatus Nitrosacidococcus tergens TaxID=553981 RepID=A0A7G1QBU2_9GAMM|nr:F0F1 ATP synthase subunit delta [Candidatus Nitrosacidococcus tergens]CAB1277631.1 F1 sector of membrane-bound ATP synthase, delta subunit [Candidatus Nitrosacidococcus tergens]